MSQQAIVYKQQVTDSDCVSWFINKLWLVSRSDSYIARDQNSASLNEAAYDLLICHIINIADLSFCIFLFFMCKPSWEHFVLKDATFILKITFAQYLMRNFV